MLGVNFFVVHSKASSLCKLNLDKNWACWNLDRCFVFFFVSVARLCLCFVFFYSSGLFSFVVCSWAFSECFGPFSPSLLPPLLQISSAPLHTKTRTASVLSSLISAQGLALLWFCDKMLVKDASVVHWHV